MKAEERHRLAENDLVKGLNRVAAGARRPSNMILLMVGLIVVLGFVYWYWSNTAANRVSRAWVQYYEHRGDLQYYERRDKQTESPSNWKSGPTGQVIQLGIADESFKQGFDSLFSSTQLALKSFEQAARQYEELIKTASNSDIQLRSLVGAARSHENLGNIDKAVAHYDSVLAKFGNSTDWKEHPLVKDAREHKQKLTGENNLAILYQSWATKLKQVTTDSGLQQPPQFPNIPMPPIPPR